MRVHQFPCTGWLIRRQFAMIFIVIAFAPDELYTSVRSRPILTEKNILGNPRLCGLILDYTHCWVAEELSSKPQSIRNNRSKDRSSSYTIISFPRLLVVKFPGAVTSHLSPYRRCIQPLLHHFQAYHHLL